MSSPSAPTSIPFLIHSKNRIGGKPNNFILTPSSYANGSLPVVIRIKQFIAPNLVPTIRTGINDIFSFSYLNTNYSITIQEAYYDANSLATTLNNAITALVPITFSYSSSLNAFQISIPISGSFTLLNNSTKIGQRLSQIIGSTSIEGTVFGSPLGVTTVTLLPPHMEGTSFIDVSLGISFNQMHTGGIQGVIGRIPVNASYGSKIIWDNTGTLIDGFPTNVGELGSLRITLSDEWGDLFYIPLNHDCSLVFSLDYAQN
jgi:hypothetical protein